MPKIITISQEEYEELEESNIGICLNCEEQRDHCEPDAREYHCEHCGQNQVFGAQELLIMGQLEFDE
jgi:hypothetical protein